MKLNFKFVYIDYFINIIKYWYLIYLISKK